MDFKLRTLHGAYYFVGFSEFRILLIFESKKWLQWQAYTKYINRDIHPAGMNIHISINILAKIIFIGETV